MRRWSVAALKSLLAIMAYSLLTGFVQIEDRVQVHGDGSATINRQAVLLDLSGMGHVAGREPDEETRKHVKKRRIWTCGMAKKAGWDSCDMTGNVIKLELHVPKNKSGFSTSEKGQASFALHHYLSGKLTRPFFPLINIGPIMDGSRENRDAIDQLKQMGYRHNLVVAMPGEIFLLWGRQVSDVGSEVRLDLLTEQPAEVGDDGFILSSAGVLHSQWFPALVIVILILAGVTWSRILRR